MPDLGEYRYVDFASKALLGFRNNVVEIRDLRALTESYGYTDCFCTYFQFDRGLSDYTWNNGHSVSGYRGPCYAHYVPLDIDSRRIEQALQTTREVTGYLLDSQGVPEEAVAIYYSGMKGFHITLATEVFGEVQPGPELPEIFRQVRQSLVEAARVTYPEAVDFGISDRLRLLRLPNTRHSKSELYKVVLHMKELLSCEPEEIRSIAKKPRGLWLTDESGLTPRYHVEPIVDAVELFNRCTEQAERNSHTDLPDPGSFLNNGDLKEALCQAEIELYREGVPEGSRSSMCLRLASRFRAAGYSEGESSSMVKSFAGRCRPPFDERAARRIVQVAYRANGKGYQFGCGNGNGDPAHTRLVYERCSYPDRMECSMYKKAIGGRDYGKRAHVKFSG